MAHSLISLLMRIGTQDKQTVLTILNLMWTGFGSIGIGILFLSFSSARRYVRAIPEDRTTRGS